jgi:hypothetical protein
VCIGAHCCGGAAPAEGVEKGRRPKPMPLATGTATAITSLEAIFGLCLPMASEFLDESGREGLSNTRRPTSITRAKDARFGYHGSVTSQSNTANRTEQSRWQNAFCS